MSQQTVNINGLDIMIEYPTNTSSVSIQTIFEEPKVIKFFNSINPKIIRVDKVTLLTHFMFGKNVGFLCMNLDAYFIKNNTKIPGFVFIRGDAAACLILIKQRNTNFFSRLYEEYFGITNYYFLKVVQPRTPLGDLCEEACAGMIDRELTKISGVMAKEILEETGIKIETTGVKTNDPRYQFNYLEKLGEFHPSIGACDETIHTFWYMTEMSSEEITNLNGRLITNTENNTTESITVQLEPFTINNICKTSDSKLICTTLQLLEHYPHSFV